MRQRDTILIVDDMEINRVILDGLFQEEYHLLEAENGEQALLLLRQYHENIAIMLLDVVMPVTVSYTHLIAPGANLLVYAIILIVVILFQPRGIMGWYNGSKFKVKVNDCLLYTSRCV